MIKTFIHADCNNDFFPGDASMITHRPAAWYQLVPLKQKHFCAINEDKLYHKISICPVMVYKSAVVLVKARSRKQWIDEQIDQYNA